MKHIATAFYQDTYAGRIAVYLKPYRTTRFGRPAICYRWMTDRGCGIPYNAHRKAQPLVTLASHNILFDSVACDIEARAHFV